MLTEAGARVIVGAGARQRRAKSIKKPSRGSVVIGVLSQIPSGLANGRAFGSPSQSRTDSSAFQIG